MAGSRLTNSSLVSGCLTRSAACIPDLIVSTARHQDRWYNISYSINTDAILLKLRITFLASGVCINRNNVHVLDFQGFNSVSYDCISSFTVLYCIFQQNQDIIPPMRPLSSWCRRMISDKHHVSSVLNILLEVPAQIHTACYHLKIHRIRCFILKIFRMTESKWTLSASRHTGDISIWRDWIYEVCRPRFILIDYVLLS